VLVGWLTVSCAPTSVPATSGPVSSGSATLTSGQCHPPKLVPVRFEENAPPSSSPRPAFTGDRFSGLGRLMALAPDGRSVVVELADYAFRVYGATAVNITAQTNFDYIEQMSAAVGAGGVASGSSDLPLAPGAPAVASGQQVVVECWTSTSTGTRGAGTAEGKVTAAAASAGASTWKLTVPLTKSWPESAQVRYSEQVHVTRLADLNLVAGQTVVIELDGAPGDYRATKLTQTRAAASYGP